MKLLLAHNLYVEDGGENAAFRLLTELVRRRGHALTLYCRSNTETRSTPLSEVVLGAFYSRRTVREIKALVERERPDIALVQNVFPLISPSIYTALRACRVPVVQLVYNYRFVCPNAHLYTQGALCERCIGGSWLHALRLRCYRDSYALSAWYAAIIKWHRWQRTFARIDRFMVPDAFLGSKLIEGGIQRERIRVAGNPFDLAEYRRSDREEPFVLYVGRLVRQKGILTLVRAIGEAKTSSRLIVVGEGDSRGAAEALASEVAPGRVAFVGSLWGAALTDLLDRCRFVCVPSEWYDNTPLVLYQAFSAGKPVIASRINGIPEVVRDGGDGLLAAPGNAADWREKIERLDQDSSLRRRLGDAARRKAETEFSADAYYQRLLTAIDGLVVI
jgi:glycosyltransferase involved in cell wall biosynthesis